MGSVDNKKSFAPRTSFKRSKGSFFSGHSAEDDTIQEVFRKYQGSNQETALD